MTERGGPSILEPGEDIKPQMKKEDVEDIVKHRYGLEGGTVIQLNGYDDLNFHYVNPKTNTNSNIQQVWPHGYLLKVMNVMDSRNKQLTEGQNAIMLFLRENNIASTVPVKNVLGQYFSVEKLPWKHEDGITREHVIRLLEFYPGRLFKNVPQNYFLYYQAGLFLAKLDEVLKDFHHPVYETHESLWCLQSTPRTASFAFVITDEEKKSLVEDIIEQFKKKVLVNLEKLEHGQIHGDFNEQNILVNQNEDGQWRVSAVLDFGDSNNGCYLFELAIALCYIIFESREKGLDPLTGAGHTLAGYQNVRPLSELEYSLLKVCVCARICQLLVLGLYTYTLHPENDYIFEKQKLGWPLLSELWKIPDEKILETWRSIVESYRDDICM